jgi:hypothetical protein
MIPASSLWQARAKAGAGGTAPVVIFRISGYARAFSTQPIGQPDIFPWISDGNAGSLTMGVNDLEGSANTSDISFTVVDVNRLITQDLQNGINLLGNVAVISVGFPGLPLSQYITLMTLVVDHIDLANQNTAYKFTLRDNSLLMQQFAFQTGDDGFPTGNNHPATIIGSPMDILQEAVTQSGLPTANINAAAIANLNTNVYFGLNQRFAVTYPPRAKDFIEAEILKPLGAYWFWNYLGQLTPYSMLPYALPVPAMILDGTNINLETPPVPMRSQDYTSIVIYKMDGDSNGQNYQTDIVGEYAPAVNLYGISQSRIIQSRGVRSSLGGARIAHLTMQNIFRRYGLKPFMMKLRCHLPAMLVEIGDKVTMNHPKVPNGMWPAVFRMPGTMGIKGTLWECKGKTIDFNDATTELDLLDVSWQSANPPYEIAPDGEGSYVPNKSSPYMFYSTPTFTVPAGDQVATYSNGDAGRLLY